MRGISYNVADVPKSQLYEGLEPLVNSGAIVLLDVPVLEQQLLGLMWRGARIDHQPGEHDDYANAVAGVSRLLSSGKADAQAAELPACVCPSAKTNHGPRGCYLGFP